jgi:hypothetical protein
LSPNRTRAWVSDGGAATEELSERLRDGVARDVSVARVEHQRPPKPRSLPAVRHLDLVGDLDPHVHILTPPIRSPSRPND